MKKTVKNAYFLIIFALICFILLNLPATNCCVFAQNVDEVLTEKLSFSTSAKSAILIEAKTGRVLFEKNSNKQLPMASTTKIVTAITVLDNCSNLDQKVKVTKDCVGVEGTSIYLKEGEELTVRELLYGLMLRSGNDASVVLAKHVANDVDSFCELMNKTATKLGLCNSSFKNPHGLDTEGHYTTAYDLAKITAYALDNKDFAEIVSTKSITVADGNSKRTFVNKNRLLNKMQDCIGVKTGFTSNAGRCLVSAAERDGQKLVCVVLNCGPMFEESEQLLNLGFEKFKMAEIVLPYQTYDNIVVENGTADFVSTYSRTGFCYPLLKGELEKINVVVDLQKSVKAPILKDSVVGKIEVYVGKDLIFAEKIYTMDKVDSKQIGDKVKQIIDNWNA